jgi:hypothetical protein
LLAAGLVVFLPQPGQHTVRHFLAQDWAWLAVAATLGGIAGWYWGRTMAIEVHPEDGTLMVKGGQAAILVLVVLILFRMGLRTGLSLEGRACASGRGADLRRPDCVQRCFVHLARGRNVYPRASGHAAGVGTACVHKQP